MKKFLLIILSLILLLPCMASNNEAKILPSEVGLVENIEYIDSEINDILQTKQIVKVKILSGDFKGNSVEVENLLSGNPYYDIKLKKNTRVILHVEDNGEGIEFSILTLNALVI